MLLNRRILLGGFVVATLIIWACLILLNIEIIQQPLIVRADHLHQATSGLQKIEKQRHIPASSLGLSPCPPSPSHAGEECYLEGKRCQYGQFCCPSCDSSGPDCTNYETVSLCLNGHWSVISSGNWCPVCAPETIMTERDTCHNLCGGPGARGQCSCHPTCHFWRSCCPDYKTECGSPNPPHPLRATVAQAEAGPRPQHLTSPPSPGQSHSAAQQPQKKAVHTYAYERQPSNVEESWNEKGWPTEPEPPDDPNSPTSPTGPHEGTRSFREWWAPEGGGGGGVGSQPTTRADPPPLPARENGFDTSRPVDRTPPEPDWQATKPPQRSHINPEPVIIGRAFKRRWRSKPSNQYRYDTLQQTLDSLLEVEGFVRENLIISQEEDSNEFVTTVIQRFGLSAEHWLHHRTPHGLIEGAEFIAEHYRWALHSAFDLRPDAHFLVVIEDDMIFSKDFLLYFSHVAPLLHDDPTVLCASAWNDNGFEGKTKDPSRLYRTQWFVGFGWLLSRRLFEGELYANWPSTHWDHWLRDPLVSKGRETVFPEVPRNYHIGVYGTHSDYDLYERFFEHIRKHDGGRVPFDAITELRLPRYEARLQARVAEAVAMQTVKAALDYRANGELVIFFEAPQTESGAPPDLSLYDAIAEELGIWHSSGGMTPRGSHNGLVHTRTPFDNELLLIPSSSPYFRLREESAPILYMPASAEPSQEGEFNHEGSVVTQPPPFALTGGIAPLGKSCHDACSRLKHKGLSYVCDDRGFPWLNNCHQLNRAFTCVSCVASDGADQPAVDISAVLASESGAKHKTGVCLWTRDIHSSCSASHPKTRRLCPCRALD